MSLTRLCIVSLVGILGCASAGTVSDGERAPSAPSKSTLLSATEIATFEGVSNAYDAVAQLRPGWLVARGATSIKPEDNDGSEFPQVFVDGQRFGALESMRNIQAHHISEIRFFNVADAGAQFGVMGGKSSVIEVRMKSARTAPR